MGGVLIPITLLNVSYKILTKALARMIQLLVARIVHKEQIGFIKVIFVLDNLITTWEGLEWAWETGQKVIFLKIDFDKAYDIIEQNFILNMLYWLGFGSMHH